MEFCSCGASLSRTAKFCGECGRQTPRATREWQQQTRAEDRRRDRGFLALGLVYASVLLTLLFGSDLDASQTVTELAVYAIDIATGLVACSLIGFASLRHSFGRWPEVPNDFLLAAALPVISLPIAFGYIALVHAALDLGEASAMPASRSLAAQILFWAVMPALVEEWLCRGVLWQAIRPATNRNIAILSTALPFAFMHVLGGTFILEVPHRFVMGLLLGWLRARTGSLWPCVLAHFLHNAIAIWVGQT